MAIFVLHNFLRDTISNMVIDETKLQSLLLDTNIISIEDINAFEKEKKETKPKNK